MNIAINNTLAFFYANKPISIIRDQVTAQGASEGPSQALSDALSQGPVEKILNLCREPEKLSVMCEAMGFTNRTKFRENYIAPLIKDGYLEMTIPDKPTSQNQRYRLTPKGVYLLSKYDEVRDDK